MAEKDRKGKSQNAIQLFFRETIGELRKVSWPTWPEARRLTGLVLLVMVVVGMLLALVEYIATLLLTGLLGG
jgi:preprotein translocase subunit SecE